jgi:hypothetical protein
MQTPMHSGASWRLMTPLPPTVRLPMLPSGRIVWASKPPSMNTLLTPGVVPKSKPKTNLWLNHCAFGLPTRNNDSLHFAIFADEGFNRPPVLLAREQERFALRIYTCPYRHPAATSGF